MCGKTVFNVLLDIVIVGYTINTVVPLQFNVVVIDSHDTVISYFNY